MFRKYKAKIQERKLDWNYEDILYNVMNQVFIYDERIYRPEILDFILHASGKAALISTDTAEYTPCILEFIGGDRYADGDFKNAVCWDARGKQYNFEDWHNNENIITVFNSLNRTPTGFIELLAYKLTEIDKSENCNVIFSRLRPFLTAHDEVTKNRIETALKSILSGDMTAIFTDPSLEGLLNSGNPSGIDVLNITNVKDAQEIQYLSHFYDTVLSRFYHLCGIGACDNGKQAQITEDELNRNECGSFTLPLSWYRGRKEGLEKAGLFFDFSPLWKRKYEELIRPTAEAEEPESAEDQELKEGEENENE